jgi:YVTN family beta-propeller protein
MKIKLNQAGQIYFLSIAFLMILNSCGKEHTEPTVTGYAEGVFINCEGSFNANNGSISWYSADSGKIVNNLFETVNGRPAGDVIQSFALAGDHGVIVANNSGKIEIVDLADFESVSSITGFSYPRFFVYSGNGKGYLSNGNIKGEVYKIDLTMAAVTDTIEVGMGPEQMIIEGHHLYVANSGGWGFDNSVSVIDTGTDSVVETIIVGDVPVALVTDAEKNIWVLCRGKVVYNDSWTEIINETDSKLVRIDPATMAVDKEVIIGQKGDYFNPSWLAVSPDGLSLLYGESGGTYVMGTDEDTQPSAPLIKDGIFSAAGVHPGSGKILAVEIKGYSLPGFLHIYDGNMLISSMETGIAPGGIVFSGMSHP